MIERTLAKRYARALLALSIKEDNVEDVEGTLLSLKEVYRKDSQFRRSLVEPRIPKAKRIELLQKPFGEKLGKAFKEFLALLVEKGRVDLIPEIADAYDRLADAHRGTVKVQIRSWKPLADKDQKALHKKLSSLTNRKIQIEVETDPALKGGLLVQIGDTVIDGSVANRLKNLRERLLEIERL